METSLFKLLSSFHFSFLIFFTTSKNSSYLTYSLPLSLTITPMSLSSLNEAYFFTEFYFLKCDFYPSHQNSEPLFHKITSESLIARPEGMNVSIPSAIGCIWCAPVNCVGFRKYPPTYPTFSPLSPFFDPLSLSKSHLLPFPFSQPKHLLFPWATYLLSGLVVIFIECYSSHFFVSVLSV